MEFAKDAPPEMLSVFLETCKWQADNDGKCKSNCSSCPGGAIYNAKLSCCQNGWANDTVLACEKSPTAKKNAQAFISFYSGQMEGKEEAFHIPDHIQ